MLFLKCDGTSIPDASAALRDGNRTTIKAITVDAGGQAHVTGTRPHFVTMWGTTLSQCLPTTAGAAQRGITNPSEGGTANFAFLAKFDVAGANLLYGTLLGPTDKVGGTTVGCAVAASGNAYLEGYTSECSFPTTAGVFEPQAAFPARYFWRKLHAGLITKLDAAGSALVWSTFPGAAPAGNGLNSGDNAFIYGMTLGTDGSVYVTGQTSGGAPSVNALYSVSGNFDFCLTRQR